eukprot:PhM_4_TR1721/c0_g1_i1/m.96251
MTPVVVQARSTAIGSRQAHLDPPSGQHLCLHRRRSLRRAGCASPGCRWMSRPRRSTTRCVCTAASHHSACASRRTWPSPTSQISVTQRASQTTAPIQSLWAGRGTSYHTHSCRTRRHSNQRLLSRTRRPVVARPSNGSAMCAPASTTLAASAASRAGNSRASPASSKRSPRTHLAPNCCYVAFRAASTRLSSKQPFALCSASSDPSASPSSTTVSTAPTTEWRSSSSATRARRRMRSAPSTAVTSRSTVRSLQFCSDSVSGVKRRGKPPLSLPTTATLISQLPLSFVPTSGNPTRPRRRRRPWTRTRQCARCSRATPRAGEPSATTKRTSTARTTSATSPAALCRTRTLLLP